MRLNPDTQKLHPRNCLMAQHADADGDRLPKQRHASVAIFAMGDVFRRERPRTAQTLAQPLREESLADSRQMGNG